MEITTLEDEAAAEEAAAGAASIGSIRMTYQRRRERSCGWWVVGWSVRFREVELSVGILIFNVSEKTHFGDALSDITYVARVETAIECYQQYIPL